MIPERLYGSSVDPAFSDTPLNVADTEAVGTMGNAGDAPMALPLVGPVGDPGEHNSAAIQPGFGPA